jgi:tRNA threonylcarbamoyladenosine modification (KEOPS) complex Cgi121 subunit
LNLKAVPLRCEKAPGTGALDKHRDVQLIDASNIAGEEHIKSAIARAATAFERGENVSKNPFIEVVVRAACNRQIKTAFEILGPKASKEVVAISEGHPDVFIAEYGCKEDKSILDIDEKKYEKIKEVFDIGEEEILAVSSENYEEKVNTLKKIISERMALLNKV